jgi:hypothetical protein
MTIKHSDLHVGDIVCFEDVFYDRMIEDEITGIRRDEEERNVIWYEFDFGNTKVQLEHIHSVEKRAEE